MQSLTRLASTLTLALMPFCVQAAIPQLVSLSPASGSGQAQTFTLTVSDADGAADIAGMNLLINTSFNGTGACWLYYDRTYPGTVATAGDNGEWGAGPRSQCAAQVVSYSDSGNQASVSISIAFNDHWTGGRNVYANVGDKEGNNSGYQQMGTWTVVVQGPVPDFTVSMTPSSQTTQPGQSASYNIKLTSMNGFSGTVMWTASASPQLNGLTMMGTGPNGVYIEVPPNGSNTGTLQVNTTRDTPPTNNIIITLDFTFEHIEHTYQVQLSLVTAAAPSITLSPTSGSSSTQTFTVTATDQGGYKAVSGINFLVNSGFNGTNACWLYYDNQQHTLALASDDASNWSNSTNIDSDSTSAQSIQNNQCAVFGGPVTATGSGNTLTLTITLTFSSTFTGPKQVWVRAGDVAGPDSGYQRLGDFTTVAGSSAPDFQLVVSPGSQTVNGRGGAFYSITIRAINGYSGTPNLSVTGVPPGTTLSPPPPPNAAAGSSTYFDVATTERTPPGNYTLTVTANDGTLSHSVNVVMIVAGAAVPTNSASPNSGAGTTQTFTFSAAGQDQASAPVALDILINDSVNGQHACWLAVDYTAHLASDDGNAWMSPDSSGSEQNSQCIVSNIQRNDSDFGYGVTLTLTFKSTFTGTKNIFMYSANAHGGDTGYQLRGTWTAQ